MNRVDVYHRVSRLHATPFDDQRLFMALQQSKQRVFQMGSALWISTLQSMHFRPTEEEDDDARGSNAPFPGEPTAVLRLGEAEGTSARPDATTPSSQQP